VLLASSIITDLSGGSFTTFSVIHSSFQTSFITSDLYLLSYPV